MYSFKIADTEITFRLNLGVIKQLESKLKKPYQQIMEEFDTLSFENKQSFLWLCVDKKTHDNLEEKEFTALSENLASSEVIKILSVLIKKDQQPTKSIEEIEKEYDKNIEDVENFQKTAMEQLMKKTIEQNTIRQ